VHEDKRGLVFATQRAFDLSPTEAGLFLVLVRQPYFLKGEVPLMSAQTVQVHICNMRRRLRAHGLTIETVQGCGYQLSAADRRRAMDMILRARGVDPCPVDSGSG
jgi:DNA-binding response OmpR family regulator